MYHIGIKICHLFLQKLTKNAFDFKKVAKNQVLSDIALNRKK